MNLSEIADTYAKLPGPALWSEAIHLDAAADTPETVMRRRIFWGNPDLPRTLLLLRLKTGCPVAWNNPAVELLLLENPQLGTHPLIRVGAASYLQRFLPASRKRVLHAYFDAATRDNFLRTSLNLKRHLLRVVLNLPGELHPILATWEHPEWVRLRPLFNT